MKRVWLRWEHKLDLKAGGGRTQFKKVAGRAAARTMDDETDTVEFLAQNQLTLEKTFPGCVWSIKKFWNARPYPHPHFAIFGELKS